MCASNERQQGLAVLQYTQDFDEAYPLVLFAQSVHAAGGNYDWTQAVQPYIKNGGGGANVNWNGAGAGNTTNTSGVWQCPSFPAEPKDGFIEYGQYQPLSDVISWGPMPTALNQISRPSDKIMVIEVGLNGPNCGGSAGDLADPAEQWYWGRDNNDNVTTANLNDFDNLSGSVGCWAWASGEEFPRYRHNGMSNFLFADGHVKAMLKGTVHYCQNIYIGDGQKIDHPWSCGAAYN
jgi:prepilin-type processing-associated H-X9-DG protein